MPSVRRASRVVVTVPVMCPLHHRRPVARILDSRSVVTRVARAAVLGSTGTGALEERVASDGLPIGMPCMS